jgi:hypothetical protein
MNRHKVTVELTSTVGPAARKEFCEVQAGSSLLEDFI